MTSDAIDRIDRRILRILQENAETSVSAIGEQVGASQATVSRRVQRMRDSGLISHQVVMLDRKKAGFNAMVFAQVKLTSHGRSNLSDFSKSIREFPEVLDCYVLMGSVDFLLRIVAEDVDAYEKFFFEKLSQLSGVQEITSSIALSEIKRISALPL